MSVPPPSSESYNLPPAAVARVLEVTRRLASTSDLGAVLGRIIDGLRDALSAERASVFQYDPADDVLFATSAHGLPNDLRIPADKGIVGEAARTRAIVNIPDAYADARFNPAIDKATGFRTRNMLTIPLVDYNEALIGVAQVLNKRDHAEHFTVEDEAVARALADQAAVALKRAALLDAERQAHKYEADLKIARDIQLAAMPARIPEFDGYDIATSFAPADETGGDTFDVIDLKNHCVGDTNARAGDALLFIADATGHGVGPAISAVSVLAMIRMASRLDGDLSRIAEAVNRQLCSDLPGGRFVTCFLGALNVTGHVLRWHSSGQAPIVFVPHPANGGEPVVLGANTGPFGIMEEMIVDEVEPFHFRPGDTLAILSDGYFEAADDSDPPEMFGIERVVACLREGADDSAHELLGEMQTRLAEFTRAAPADDDRTAIIVKRHLQT